MEMQVTFTGNLEMLDRYIDQLKTAVIEVVARDVVAIASDAQGRVAVETGSLRDSIDAEERSRGEGTGEWTINAGNMRGGYIGGGRGDAGQPVDYAYVAEYLSNQPYLTPASEAAVPRILRAVAEACETIGVPK